MTAPPDDELSDTERHALAAWAPTPPPAGFAERVVAARATPADATTARTRRRRVAAWSVVAAAAVAGSLIAYGALGRHPGTHASRGLLAPNERTTAAVGDRVVVVAEPAADLRWDITPDGAGDVTQRAGDVFYRVDHGGPLVVHTPAGDIHVTGTCFRVEVAMNKASQMILAGAAGAAVATGVVITVYEGRVVADTRGARTELLPGTRTVLDPQRGGTRVAAANAPFPAPVARPLDPALDVEHATREQLIARLSEQQQELAKLRAPGGAGPGGGLFPRDSKFADGRRWFDPSAETLRAWARECRVRFDEPVFDHPPADDPRGITADEMPEYQAALAEVRAQFHALVRTLYIQATGDTAGADTLSVEAMTQEINDKATPDAAQAVNQRVAQERAGLATPPVDTSHQPPVEQLIRAQVGLGDATQAAIAKRLGPDRATAIRGDSWGRLHEAAGCPDPK